MNNDSIIPQKSKEVQVLPNKDLVYSSFRLHKNGLEAIGKPSFEQWQECGEFIKRAEGATHYWLGDWLRYGEDRWGEEHSQALEADYGYDYDTLRRDKWVSEKIPPVLRSTNMTFSNAREIAPLPQEEKEYWAEELKKEAIPVRELKQRIKERKKAALPKPEIPEGTFSVIYADPPWQYDFSETESRRIENQYPTMTVEEISEMKIPAHNNSVLYLWATAPKLREALQVMDAWGFDYKTHMIWDKQTFGMGYWFRGQHELLLVATKGEFSPPEESLRVPSVYLEKKTQHSKKPLKIYEWLELWYPDEKYLELFARNKYSDKWVVYGNQL